MSHFEATTILAVRHAGRLTFGGDGQVTFQNTIIKHSACKIRRLSEFPVLAGFAGSAADAFTLFERFEARLKEFQGKLGRAAVELGRDWRTDRYLRRLEALLVVGDAEGLYLLSGMGDVIQPDDDIVGIGSGGNFAVAAARGLTRFGRSDLSSRQICEAGLKIASEICPFTNDRLVFEEL
jgi:ATP-dependent HslUV protease subunit HslV